MTILVTLKNEREIETEVSNESFDDFAQRFVENGSLFLVTDDAVILKDAIHYIQKWS
ncbi:hypothetical protein [Paenibacillus cremeus]|uniref:hypothetical protein n=1 Tax=Paenibacillus cremeus TaxID=2163881 RepID=UPI001647A7B7|nr:hypothetical protein [Paenibacillus cremeus]